MTTPTHDELRRLTARMLDDEAIGEHDRSLLLAYIAQVEATERDLATRTTEFTQLSDSFIALQNEHAADAKIAAVVRENSRPLLRAAGFISAVTRGTADASVGEEALAAAKALAEALKT